MDMKQVNIPQMHLEVLGSILTLQICCITSLVRTKRVKKLKEMKKDDTVRNLLESKFDRETLAVLLGIDKRNTRNIATL
jgi:hypothetical protein